MRRRDFLAALGAGAFVRRLGAQTAMPRFVDIAAKAGVNFRCLSSRTSQKYLIETMVGGVAMFDYNNDGRLDLFFVNGAALADPMPPGRMPDKTEPRFWNRLYRNNGDGTFTDVTERAGVQGHSFGMGVAVGDYDNDGNQDLYITNYGRNILYHNHGDGTFTDVTEKAGVAAGGWSASACFVDYDRDGRLDLVVSRYLDWDIGKNPWCGDEARHFRGYCHPEVFPPVTHIVYHNNGDGTFSDVTAKAGLANLPGNGLGIAFNDYDGDGWPDILVANDALPQQLFRNNHDGTFKEVGILAGLSYDEDGKAFSGMGIGFEDYVTTTTGLGRISLLHSAWGIGFVDCDNDGWKDLFIAQSHVMDNIEQTQPSLRYKEPLALLRNVNGKFEDVSKQAGDPFQIPLAARGVAFGDLDNDGFIDAAINCLDGSAMVLRNQGGNGNHWLIVDPRGTVSNRDGIGARVHLVSASGQHQWSTVSTAGSYTSARDKRVHFGLGKESRIPLLEIAWPSGALQKLEDVAADQVLRVVEPSK